MWQEPFSLLRYATAVLATGIAIKLMDDTVDGEENTLVGLTTAGAAVYAMGALAVGVALAPLVTLPLFASAYAIGMLHDLRETLPSGMPAWLESALALAIAAVVAGASRTAHAFLVIVALQLADDLFDFAADAAMPGRNLAHRFGRGEAALLAAICLVLATLFGIALPVATAAGYALIRLLSPRPKGRLAEWRN